MKLKLRPLNVFMILAVLTLFVPATSLATATPTAVELVSFEAVAQSNTIQVTWDTGFEFHNLGFNLYRAESVDGPRTQLNDSLIPSEAPGNAVGASYEFVDMSVRPHVTYYYWLETVEMVTGNTEHGPVSAELQALYSRLVPLRPRLAPRVSLPRSR